MSEDVLLTVQKNHAGGVRDAVVLAPSDMNSYDVVSAMTEGEVVRCEISRPRNARHHRLAFALLKEVYKNQQIYSTFENMYDAIKIATGLFDMFVLPGGERVFRTRSLAWHMMDQSEFNEWWDKFLNVILNHIIPATKRADLEQRVYEMLGETTPKDLAK